MSMQVLEVEYGGTILLTAHRCLEAHRKLLQATTMECMHLSQTSFNWSSSFCVKMALMLPWRIRSLKLIGSSPVMSPRPVTVDWAIVVGPK